MKLRTHCKTCNVELDATNSVYNGFRRNAKCHKCYRKYLNIWVKENRKRPEILIKHKEDLRQRYYEKSYGITEQEYNRLVEFQQNGCAICKLPCKTHDRLSVDHDHDTGQVRGLLCQKCNTAIAMLNENEDLFWNVLEYFKKHKWDKVA